MNFTRAILWKSVSCCSVVGVLLVAGCGGGERVESLPGGMGTGVAAQDASNPSDPPWWEEWPEGNTEEATTVVAVEGNSKGPAASGVVDVCISLVGNRGNIGGVQADLLWDPGCLSAVLAERDEVECQLEPGTGRDTFATRLISPGRMRGILLNLSSTRPMPAEVSRLFCCSFRTLVPSGERCEVDLDTVILSDPFGRRLPVELRPGAIESGS